MHHPIRHWSFIALCALAMTFAGVAQADTLEDVLARAYENNASLQAARAGARATHENVPIARSGVLPTIAGEGQLNYQTQSGADLFTGSFGVSIRQSIFDGFQTQNNVHGAEANVRASHESLRNTEQNVLFNAASAYTDVLRDRQVAVLRERNLNFLQEQVRAARSRFEVGEGTSTDVAQAEASSAAASAQLAAARAQTESSEALFRQVVGAPPGSLRPASPPLALIPASLDAALSTGIAGHPAIRATQHLVDAAGFSVKAAEGALLPQVSASVGATATYTDPSGSGLPGVGTGASRGTSTSATIGLNLTIPIYQGGGTSARVRQSKEQMGEARIQVDVTRAEVRQAISSSWGQYSAAREALQANRQLVSAADLVLDGVMQERDVGQRTTLDVLNAQADLINARINVLGAERDMVVAGYAILSSSGRLTASDLGLPVAIRSPAEHYEAVRGRWYGTVTPDGR